jgi:hypothetical protein
MGSPKVLYLNHSTSSARMAKDLKDFSPLEPYTCMNEMACDE